MLNIVPTFLFPSPLVSRILLLPSRRMCPVPLTSLSPLGQTVFLDFSLTVSTESARMTFYASFFRTLGRGDQVPGRGPKPLGQTEERGGGGPANNFLTASFPLAPSFLLPKKGEVFVNSLPASARQPELLCQVCPLVGAALWGPTGGRAPSGKLLLLLYLRGGSWFPWKNPVQNRF